MTVKKAAEKMIGISVIGLLMCAFAVGWYYHEYLAGDLEAKAEALRYLFNGAILVLLIFLVWFMVFALSKYKGY